METALVKQFIARGDTETALQHLMDMLFDSPLETDATLLAGRFQKIRREIRLGTADENQGQKEINQINLAVLELLDSFEASPPISPNQDHKTPFSKQLFWLFLAAVLLAVSGWYFFQNRATNPDRVYPFQYKQRGIPSDLLARLDSLQQAGQPIKQLAFGPSGEWAVLFGRNQCAHNGNLPLNLKTRMDTLRRLDAEFNGLYLGQHSDFLLWIDRNDFWLTAPPRNFPPLLLDSLYLYHRQNREIKDIAIAPDKSWVILWGQNGYTWEGLHDSLRVQLTRAAATNAVFKQIAFSQEGSWVFLYGPNGYSYGFIDPAMLENLNEIGARNQEILGVSLRGNNEWIIFYK